MTISEEKNNKINDIKENDALFSDSDFAELKRKITAIEDTHAVAEFDMNGSILRANRNFLDTFGYTSNEIIGRHHRIFVEPEYAQSPDYQNLWKDLNRTISFTGEQKRITKNGQRIWFYVTYIPILDEQKKPTKVIKFATNITNEKIEREEYFYQITAIDKSFAVTEFDMNGNILTANENFLKIIGYSLKELQGKHHSFLIEDHVKKSHEYEQFWENLRKGIYNSGEYKRIGKGEKEIWLQASYNPILDSMGRPYKVIKYSLDITEQTSEKITELKQIQEETKRANEELAIQNKLKTAMEEVANCVRGELSIDVLCDNVLNKLAQLIHIQVGVFYVNRGDLLELASSYAYVRRKHLSTQFSVGEGIVGQCAKERKIIVISSIPDDYIKISSGLGETSPNSIMVVPILFEKQLLGVLEIGKLTPFSNEDILILEHSAQNVGIALNSAIGRVRMQELLQETQAQEEELRAANEEMQTQQEEMRVQQETLLLTNKNLEHKTNELKEFQKEIQDQNILLEKQKEDLVKQKEFTEEKKIEIEKARQHLEEKAKELEISNKYKSEFLANMSHELRTPLNSLLILSETLGQNEDGNLTSEQVESAQIIHGAGKDLLNLINDILDLSKVEAGKLDIHLEDIEIENVLESLKRQFSHVAEHKKINFKTENKCEPNISIRTDSNRLEQILKNFLSNAFKFTEKGSVTLRADTFVNKQNLSDQKQFLQIKVIDTGIGISPDKQRLIFEAFQQVDGSISRQYGGTGLGLSISRELAKLLGCEIKVESVLGEGSAFILQIPASVSVLRENSSKKEIKETKEVQISSHISEADTSVPVPSNDVQTGIDHGKTHLDEDRNFIPNKRRLLIIEDDEAFKNILLKFAESRAYEVITAKDAKEGLEIARNIQPSAISLDVGLPDISGLEVLQELKSDLSTRFIPVYIISASEDLVQYYQNGAIGVSRKPVDLKRLSKIFDKIDCIHDGEVRNILVVEDDTKTQQIIKELFNNPKIKITQATSGEEAIKFLQDYIAYDVMILDLGLPDMTGLNLLKKLEELNFDDLPPIIVYTGRELNEKEYLDLKKFTPSFVMKGVNSTDRLLEEASLFLHMNLKKSGFFINSNLSSDLTIKLKEILKDKRVLLVDDDLRNTFALSGVLKRYGLDVVMADNGKMALDLLEENSNVNLIIMDIMMPVMDGYEAITKIRQQKKFDNTPIIALTAKALDEARQRAFDCGADDFLTKPVETQKLLEVSAKWLSSLNAGKRAVR